MRYLVPLIRYLASLISAFAEEYPGRIPHCLYLDGLEFLMCGEMPFENG